MNIYGANVVTLANVVATVVESDSVTFNISIAHWGKVDNSG